jgi:hypothetical protein
MKKFRRIFLLVVSTCILFFGTFILVRVFGDFDVFSKIKADLGLLIPIHFSFFSIFSILFSIKKFQNNADLQITSTIYKGLRIGDFIFSISLFLLTITGLYHLTKSVNSSNNLDTTFYLIRIGVLLLLFAFSILLFIDNIVFNATQKIDLKKDYIDEIGQ